MYSDVAGSRLMKEGSRSKVVSSNDAARWSASHSNTALTVLAGSSDLSSEVNESGEKNVSFKKLIKRAYMHTQRDTHTCVRM